MRSSLFLSAIYWTYRSPPSYIYIERERVLTTDRDSIRDQQSLPYTQCPRKIQSTKKTKKRTKEQKMRHTYETLSTKIMTTHFLLLQSSSCQNRIKHLCEMYILSRLCTYVRGWSNETSDEQTQILILSDTLHTFLRRVNGHWVIRLCHHRITSWLGLKKISVDIYSYSVPLSSYYYLY